MPCPTKRPSQVESTNFIVVGSVNETVLKQISEYAEAQATILKNQFGLPADKPLIKGRATIFAIKSRIDYVEWKVVEEREPPLNLRGHARHNVIDAYAVLWVPADEKEFSLKTLVNEQVKRPALRRVRQRPLAAMVLQRAGPRDGGPQ